MVRSHMDEYTPSTYGDRIARVFDDWYHDRSFEKDPGSTVAFLAALAGEGPALELGIGTGRIALPLQEAGIEVHGIDASERMLERLRAKPGGDRIPVTMGSFADFSLKTRFHLCTSPSTPCGPCRLKGNRCPASARRRGT